MVGAVHAVIVVPCFNEATRLDPAAFAEVFADARLAVLAVDDGSSDDTRAVLARIAASHPGRMEVASLTSNSGKAAAVRHGLRQALEAGAEVVGYADADFATPPSELSRLLDELERANAEVVLGSRIRRLGADIVRSPVRHLIGRVFATVAASAVGVPVYDTQCGAKFFRRTRALDAALAEPFTSRWSFDVELLGRLFGSLPAGEAADPARALEVPLREWRDVGGSKLQLGGMARSFGELLTIWGRAKRFGARRR